MKYKFLSFPWKNEFIDIVGKTKKELFISSPFINVAGVKILSDSIQTRSSVRISLITNLTTQNIINRITEPAALLELYKQFDQVNISSLGKLHAKVYLVDNEIGIITSANLTSGGLINNFEYGVFIDDKNVISTIKEDMTDNSIKNTRVAQLLKKATETIDFELLKSRIREGKTINAIFSDTVLYVLKERGPLSTNKLHPLIQLIHPDICDDSIDRVIGGQHFGKKWKHSVRNAQKFLKNKELIYLKDGKWYLTN